MRPLARLGCNPPWLFGRAAPLRTVPPLDRRGCRALPRRIDGGRVRGCTDLILTPLREAFMSDVTVPNIPGPEAPVSALAPPAVPAPGTWRPAPVPIAPGGRSPLQLRSGSGSYAGNMLAEIWLATAVPSLSGLVDHASVEDPIRASLRERLQGSDATKRYRELREHHRLAAQRQAVAAASVAKIGADRQLTEARAAPGLGTRLAKLTRDAEAAKIELDAAEAAAKELAPLVAAARQTLLSELWALLPALTFRERTRLVAEGNAAREEVLDAVIRAASAELTRLVKLDATFHRIFVQKASDFRPLAEALIDEPGAAAEASADASADAGMVLAGV
jgi:hypothetical protein